VSTDQFMSGGPGPNLEAGGTIVQETGETGRDTGARLGDQSSFVL